MNRYEIKCTPEQTKKAFELGAPIKMTLLEGNQLQPIQPTAEQMINWLEDQEDILNINIHLYEDDGYPKMCGYGFTIYNKNKDIIVGTFTEKGSLVYICPKSKEYIYLEGSDNNNFLTKQEATIEAIDAALEYLMNKKK